MQIIVISSSKNFENEAEVVTKLFEAGLETFHLRKPKLSTRELKKYISHIPKQFHSRIVINSHHSLAGKFKLKGIHLTKTHHKRNVKTKLVIKWLRFLNPKLIVSTSYTKLISVFEKDDRYSYVGLSPIFDSLIGKYQSGFADHRYRLYRYHLERSRGRTKNLRGSRPVANGKEQAGDARLVGAQPTQQTWRSFLFRREVWHDR